MANISNAYGTFTIDEREYEQNKRVIDEIFEDVDGSDDYGVNDINYVGGGVFNFAGDGRWNFQNSLVDPFAGHVLPVSKIEFHYYDYECGSEFLIEQNMTIEPDTKSNNLYKVTENSTYDIEYTDENIIKYDFEEGYNINENKDEFLTAVENFYYDCDDKFQVNHSLSAVFTTLHDYIQIEQNGYVMNWKMEDFDSVNEMFEQADLVD